MPRLVALSAVLLLALPSVAPAGDPLADAVRGAVAARKLRETDLQGNGTARSPYRDVATDGAVLVGLEVGLGGAAPAERVVAVRPVYRLGGRDRAGAPAGQFLSDDVTRTARIIARNGYAVAGLFVSAGRRLDGLAVRFARIDGAGLNPADTYESEWVGSIAADRGDPLDGRGQPAAGLFGRLEGDAVVAVGLTFADLPRPTPTPAVALGPASALELEKPAEPAPESSGTWVWVVLVLGALAVPVGVVILLALRRKPRGVQQLPPLPAVRAPAPAPAGPEGASSIPGVVLRAATSPAPAARTGKLETESVWR